MAPETGHSLIAHAVNYSLVCRSSKHIISTMTLVVSERAVATPLPTEAQRHQFTLNDYHRLAELGFFEDRRVEFIDGEILDMPPQRDPHTYAVTQATYWCHEAFDRNRFWVRVQSTLIAGDSSPEPDLAILDFPATIVGDYPAAAHAVLLIEVADSTLLADTKVKAGLYASAGVQDYWVASIPDRSLIVHRQPVESKTAKHGFAYAEVRRYAPGQMVSPLANPAAAIDPGLLFG